MKKTIILAGVVALSLGCWLASAPGNADIRDDSAIAVDAPFKSPVIVVTSKIEAVPYAVLQGTKVQKLGERNFLVGTGVDYKQPNEWTKGKVIWIPIDDVAGVTEFASIEAYRKVADAAVQEGAKKD